MADLFQKFVEDQRKKTDLVYQSMFSAAGSGHDGGAPPLPNKPGPGNSRQPAPPPPSRGPGPGNSPAPAPPPKQSPGPGNSPQPAPPPRDWRGIEDRIARDQATPPPTTWEPVERPSLRDSRAFEMPAPMPVANFAMPNILNRPQPLAGYGGIDTIGNGGGRGPAYDTTMPTTEPVSTGDGTYTVYVKNDDMSEVIIENGTDEAVEYESNTGRQGTYSKGRDGMTYDEAIEYGAPMEFIEGEEGAGLPVAPPQSIISNTAMQDAIARGEFAKQNYAEPKDMPGYNDTITGISTRLAAERKKFDAAVARGTAAKERDGAIAEPKDIPGFTTTVPSLTPERYAQLKQAEYNSMFETNTEKNPNPTWTMYYDKESGQYFAISSNSPVADQIAALVGTDASSYVPVQMELTQYQVDEFARQGKFKNPYSDVHQQGTPESPGPYTVGTTGGIIGTDYAPPTDIIDDPKATYSIYVNNETMQETLVKDGSPEAAALDAESGRQGTVSKGRSGMSATDAEAYMAPVNAPTIYASNPDYSPFTDQELIDYSLNYPTNQWRGQQAEVVMKYWKDPESLTPVEQQVLGWILAQEKIEDIDGPGLGLSSVSPVDFGEWMLGNRGAAEAAYAEGGWQAVWEEYQSTANIGQRILRDITNDPWTFVPVVAAPLKGLEGGSIAARFGRGAGEALSFGERAGSLFADDLIGGAFGAIKRTPYVEKIFAPSNTTERASRLGNARDTSGRVVTGFEPTITPVVPTTPQSTWVYGPEVPNGMRTTPSAYPNNNGPLIGPTLNETTTSSPVLPGTVTFTPIEPISPEGIRGWIDGNAPAVKRLRDGGATDAEIEAAASWDLRRGNAARPVEPIQEGDELVNIRGQRVEADDVNIDGGPAGIRTATGNLDVSNVPTRFHPYLRNLADANDAPSVQLFIDDSSSIRGFQDQVNRTRELPGNSNPASAATTGEYVADFYAQYAAINPSAVLPAFTPSTAKPLGPNYRNFERAIHQPWSDTAGSRQILSNNNVILDTVPDAPSSRQLVALDNYVRLIDQYRFWHPTAVFDADFAAAVAKRDAIAKYFTDRGLAYGDNVRKGGGGRTAPASGGATPTTTTNVRTPGGATPQQATGPQRPRSTATTSSVVHPYGDVAGYPIIPGTSTGPNPPVIVRIDADTTVALSPVEQGNVPQDALDRFPGDTTPTWTEAVVQDAKLPDPVRHYAPTREAALDLAVQDAQGKGLVGDFFDRPAARQTGEALDFESDAKARTVKVKNPPNSGKVRTLGDGFKVTHDVRIPRNGANAANAWTVEGPNGTAHIVNEAPDTFTVIDTPTLDETSMVRATQDPDAADFDTFQEALVEGQLRTGFDDRLAEANTAHAAATAKAAQPQPTTAAFNSLTRSSGLDDRSVWTLSQAAQKRGWSQEQSGRITTIISRMKGAQRQTILDAPDLATAGGKQVLDRVQELDEVIQAIKHNQEIVNNPKLKGRKVGSASNRLRDLKTQQAQLENQLWITERVNPKMAPNTTLFTEIANLTPTQKKYAASLRRTKTVQPVFHVSSSMPSEHGLTIDGHGVLRFRGAILDEMELDAMTRDVMEGGDTFLDRWNKYIDLEFAKSNGTGWPPDVMTKARGRALKDYEAFLGRAYPTGKPPFGLRTLTKVTDAVRRMILYSWASAMRIVNVQAFGNAFITGLGGYGKEYLREALDPRLLARAFNLQRKASGVTGTLLTDMGDGYLLSFERDILESGAAATDVMIDRISRDLEGGGASLNNRAPGKQAAIPIRALGGDQVVADVANSFDSINRSAVGHGSWNRRLKQDVPEFTESARVRLGDAGFSQQEIDNILTDLWAKHSPRSLKMADVRQFMRGYLDGDIADRLGRDWQSLVNKRREFALSEVARVTFGGTGRTKLDDALAPFIMFSYFQSRQGMFMIRQALRHPALMNAYLNWQEEMEQYAAENKDKLPSWAQGAVSLASIMGVNVFWHPFALLQTGALFNGPSADWESQEDKTRIQKWLDADIPIIGGKVQDWAFFNPVIMSLFNLTGYTGDDRDFDPLFLAQEGQIAAFLINVGKDKGWVSQDFINDGLVGNPAINAGNFLRGKVTENFKLPGANVVEWTNESEAEQREFNAILVRIAEEELGLDPNDPEDADEILGYAQDPDSPIYKQAMDEYLKAELVNIGIKQAPFFSAMRPMTRLADGEGNDLINSQTSRGQTELRNITDADAANLKNQSNQFYQLGDPFDPLVDDLYTDLVYGDVTTSVTLNGETYSAEEINSWDTETRKDFASAFLVDNGLYEGWQEFKEEQSVFLADPENTELAQQRTWSTAVRDYDGGVEQYWEDLAEGNPNAKAYLDGIDPSLTDEEREKALTNQRAFMAVKGVQPYYNAPTPIDTNAFDPVNIANGPAKPIANEPYVSEFDTGFYEELDTFTQYANEAEPIMREIMTEWGLDPNVPLNQTGDHWTQEDLMDAYYDRTGFPYPEPKGKVAKYIQWANKQPAGADTSPEAYLEWSNDQYVAKMPESFNEDIDNGTPSDPTVDPIDFANRSRTLDPGYRWEDQEWYLDEEEP